MKRHLVYTITIICLLAVGTTSSVVAQKKTSNKNTEASKRKIPSSKYPGQFPESSERLLTEKDVEHQTAWGMKVMMNEIYARHGYVFRDADLKKHFRREKWYKGKEKNMKNIKLTDIEIQNITFIKNAQQHPKL